MNRRLMRVALGLMTPVCLSVSMFAQGLPPQGFENQIAQMREAAGQNEQQLRQYQWIETATVNINGSSKPPKQSLCRYAPDGMLKKTPLGGQQQPPRVSGGPLKRMITEKKIEEFQDEIVAIHSLAGMYLPINQAKFQEALRTHRVDFEHAGPEGNAIVIHDYAKPGDELRIGLNVETKHIQRLTVHSYFEKPSEAFTASVDFSVLGDGTSYPALTTVSAPAKKITITTVNSDYSHPAY